MKPRALDIDRMTIGQIAARVPYATQLFHRHGLDYCCRGNQGLRDACRRKGVDEKTISAELKALLQKGEERDWAYIKDDEVIRHLLDHCHFELRAHVPEILWLARKVEVSHAGHVDCPTGLTEKLTSFWRKLEAHLEAEELGVFPWISGTGEAAGSAGMMEQMMLEHKQQGDDLKAIRLLARHYLVPRDACPTWKALYLSLERLEQDLIEHIHLENNVLFERALRLLDDAADPIVAPPSLAQKAR